jgi:hypothetical protein
VCVLGTAAASGATISMRRANWPNTAGSVISRSNTSLKGGDMATEGQVRECPFCKEEIKADAIKCKHCRSTVKPEIPPHGGTCPYCKEAIKPEAIKCKHCGSMVGSSAESGCCEGCAEKAASAHGAAERDFFGFGSPGTGSMIPPLTAPTLSVPTLSAGASCSACSSGGCSGFGIQVCCKRVYIPFIGWENVCYILPCYVLSTPVFF